MLISLNTYKKSRKYKGAIAIEFALVMTFILVPLLLGTIELGRLIYQYNNLAKSVRDGTKYLSTVATSVPNYATYIEEAKCLAVFGNVGCNGKSLASGLTKSNIVVSSPTTIPGIKVVMVSVNGYKADLITTIFKPFNFNNISVTMRQQE